MDIKPETLRDELVSILKENSVPFRSVSAVKEETLDRILGIKWDGNGKIILEYCDLLEDYTDREVKAVLRHEACHYISLPTSWMIFYRGKNSLNAKYAMVFREYLAHKEFKNRFGFDEDLKSYQKKLFNQYFSYLLKGGRYIIKHTGDARLEVIITSVFAMVYTAIYYFVFDYITLKRWCQINDASNLYVFFSWIYDDMRYFDEMTASSEEKEHLIQKAADLVLSMDYCSLVMNNELRFNGKILEEKNVPEEFLRRWEMRLGEHGAEII